MCLEQGVTPAYVAVGAAGAVYRYLNEAGTEQSAAAAGQVLAEVSGLGENHPLAALILEMYGLFLEGETVGTMRRAAQKVKTGTLRPVI